MSNSTIADTTKSHSIKSKSRQKNLLLNFPESELDLEYALGEALPAESKVVKTLARKEASILSPLRYPGAKRRFAGYVAESLKLNCIRPKLFVEPFAGGASVALQLLNDDLVDAVGLGEIDPLVASFWQCVFYDTEWLIKSVESEPITLERWRYYKTASLQSTREKALACLFLNRTSFSGILAASGGPIGGQKQESEYKIDCRFNRKTIIKHLEKTAALRDRIMFVHQGDWKETFALYKNQKPSGREIFTYLDPPFYHKAQDLYRHFFDAAAHCDLRKGIARLRSYWLLSYDAADEIKKLYSTFEDRSHTVELLYIGAPSKTQKPVKEIVISNLPHLPAHNRLWRTKAEWENCSENFLDADAGPQQEALDVGE